MIGKYTIDDIRLSMSKEGYILKSTIYSSINKLEYICDKGHSSSMLSCNWNGGRRCPVCKGIAIGNEKRLDFNTVINSFESENYILLTKESEYVNNKTKLRYICYNGHEHCISWTKWQQGERCAHCAISSKIYFSDVKDSFNKEGYNLISKSYHYNKKLKYVCPNGHEHETVWGHWQQGKRCPSCWNLGKIGSGHWNWKGGISCEPYCKDWTKEFKDFIKERDGYKCLNPDCWKKDKVLTVHHIDYNKKNCGPENLITVCRSCNSRANTDREWHKAWYQAILNKRYKYGYQRS